MKKTVTKLKLNRETLRSLEDNEAKPLQAVVGGFTVITCIGRLYTSCNMCPAM